MKKYFLSIMLLYIFNIGTIVAQQYSDGSVGTHNNAYTVVPPPSIFTNRVALQKTASSIFHVNYSSTYPAPSINAQTAVEYAASIWSYLLNSSQQITILAEWKDLGYDSKAGYKLAECGPDTFYNSPNFVAPNYTNIQYPVALAESILHQSLNMSNEQMTIVINNNDSVLAKWYYGTDGVPQKDKFDLVSIVLHELGHGLGIISSFNVNGANGYFGYSNYPVNTDLHPLIFDKFLQVGNNYLAQNPLINFPNNSTTLKTQVTSNNIYFDGTNTYHANGDSCAKIYAPNPWKAGSSLSHLNDNTYPKGNTNTLMISSRDMAQVVHSPGEVGLSMLADLGWSVNRLVAFINPVRGVAFRKGDTDTLKWTDTQTGVVNITLYDSQNNPTTIYSSFSDNIGLNKYVWLVPSTLANGTYTIRIAYTGTYGVSDPFTISNMPICASPVFSPAPGNYATGCYVKVTNKPTGGVVRYNLNSVQDPDSTSTLFPDSLYISTSTTIKALAFKTGSLQSPLKVALYNIGAEEPAAAVVSPASGKYANSIIIHIDFPSDAQCFWNYTENGSNPHDPSQSGYSYELINNPYIQTFNIVETVKINIRTYKNGVWGPMVSVQYNIVQGFRIAQVDDENSSSSFGKWSDWENNNWVQHTDSALVPPTSATNYYLLAQQTFEVGTSRKYNNWARNDGLVIYPNYSSITINPTTTNVLAHFKGANNATIQAQLDGVVSGDSLSFLDPWMIDYQDSYGLRNQGTSAPLKSVAYSQNNIGIGSSHKGVFLNQVPNPSNSSIPYYSVKAPLTKTINGFQGYFQNWSSSKATFQQMGSNPSGYDQKAVVITDTGATITANYKGIHISGNISAFANNGQRKLVRTTDGALHMVYESLGHVWYEMSTNNGSTWTIANNGKPLDTNGGKLPAIDCSGIYGDNFVAIVWEEKNGEALQLKIGRFRFGVMAVYYPLIAFDDINQSYSQNLNPVIAYDYENRAVIAWENKGSSVYPIGIVAEHGVLATLLTPINPPIWPSDYGTAMSSTDINCVNPTISAVKNPVDQYNMYYNLAWQYNQSASSSSINYCILTANSGGVTASGITNISSSDGCTLNYRPSIMATSTGGARVCWIGDVTGSGSVLETVFKDPTNSRFWYFGSNVVSTSINCTDSNSAYYVAWSQNTSGNSYTNKFTDSGTLSHISTTNTTGKDIQLSNGAAKSSMYISSFSPFTAPYFFTTSNNLNTFAKANANAINSGRGGVITKNGAQFFYSFGDLTIDNNNIDFVKAADTIKYNNLNEINNVLVTNPFTVNNNSTFIFSECSGVLDSLTALTVVGDSGYVSYKAELIDNSTNNVIGTIRDSRLNANALHSYNLSSFNLGTDGLSGKTVKVKITISTNLDSYETALTDRYADASSISKTISKALTLQGSEIIKEYALSQNYPNPFNPTTIISYQIPKDGLVTVKIYDILGSEVKTLTNGYKTVGKYSVSFDASRLASGVYFYQLRSNGFVSTKKMLLLK